MPRYEYKVVPAPQKGLKAKGIKTAEGRFSNSLETLLNAMAADGWEYQRAETLPSLERSGLTSTTTEWRNVLVFRRLRDTTTEAFSPELLPAPVAASVALAAAPPVTSQPKGSDAPQSPNAKTGEPDEDHSPSEHENADATDLSHDEVTPSDQVAEDDADRKND